MIFPRLILKRIIKNLFHGKAIIIYGARRVGKTTLVRQIQSRYPEKNLYLNCDEPDVRAALSDKTSTELLHFIGKKELVTIDEAQRVRNIGLTLKLLVDNAPKMQVVATGSSSFDLSNKVKEPLTGRAFEFYLPPLALIETEKDPIILTRLIDKRLVFGLYPEVVTDENSGETILRGLYRNYLYKDALEFQNLKNPEMIEKLLAALSLQIGSEVSFTELGSLLGVDQKTIATYIRLLELAFIVFRLPPLSRNLRKEISKSRKIYFWDTGIRNAIINNFNPLNLRSDTGPLWENFIISERMKYHGITGSNPNTYFWRTWTKQEVDYVEEQGGRFDGYEIKWQEKKVSPPKAWKTTYPNTTWQTINRVNFLSFITP